MMRFKQILGVIVRTSCLLSRVSLLLCAALILSFLIVPGVNAEGGYGAVRSITEYRLPVTLGSPRSITRGPDGAMWYTNSARTIGRITLSGKVTEFQCPTDGEPWDITTGPDGNLWFCEMSPTDRTSTGKRLGRITTSGTVTMFGGLAGYHDLRSITCGPDGALWFTDVGANNTAAGANKVGRITTAGAVTEFPCGTGIWPTDIITGPDGALWFTNADRICRMTTAGQLKEFPLGGSNTSVSGLTVGPDGALWSTLGWFDSSNPDINRSYVVRMLTSGEFSLYDVENTFGYGGKITTGADGAMWFIPAVGDRQGFVIRNIGRITTTGASTEYLTPSANICSDIAAGPAGTVWAIEDMAEGYAIVAKIDINPGLPPSARWKSTSYFAEGWTGEGFQEYACVENPNPVAAPVWLTYMTSQGVSDTQYLWLAPTSRVTVDINQLVGPDKEVSLRVVSTSPGLVVERPIYFNYRGKWTGGHDVMGVQAPGRVFYFAEGSCRPGFEPYYCVMNPGKSAANVSVTYMTGDGSAVRHDGVVRAHSRLTFRPVDRLGEGDDAGHDFAAKVECTNGQEIVCERPMYFFYKGVWTGGHDVTGLAAPANRFYFAEGTCRPGFDTYFCILNPGNSDADVRIDYATGDCQIRSQALSVGKRSRATVKAKDLLGEGEDIAHDFSAKVTCTNGQQIICERPMYFNYRGNWTGGHDVMGATGLAKKYYFAEGSSRANMDQYFSVWNPNSEPLPLRIIYMFTDGTVLEQHLDIESRATINCRDFLAGSGKLDCDFSAVVDSFVGNNDFLIERPMYFDFHGWTGGHDVIGHEP